MNLDDHYKSWYDKYLSSCDNMIILIILVPFSTAMKWDRIDNSLVGIMKYYEHLLSSISRPFDSTYTYLILSISIWTSGSMYRSWWIMDYGLNKKGMTGWSWIVHDCWPMDFNGWNWMKIWSSWMIIHRDSYWFNADKYGMLKYGQTYMN